MTVSDLPAKITVENQGASIACYPVLRIMTLSDKRFYVCGYKSYLKILTPGLKLLNLLFRVETSLSLSKVSQQWVKVSRRLLSNYLSYILPQKSGETLTSTLTNNYFSLISYGSTKRT